jgi:hypothetical protein
MWLISFNLKKIGNILCMFLYKCAQGFLVFCVRIVLSCWNSMSATILFILARFKYLLATFAASSPIFTFTNTSDANLSLADVIQDLFACNCLRPFSILSPRLLTLSSISCIELFSSLSRWPLISWRNFLISASNSAFLCNSFC